MARRVSLIDEDRIRDRLVALIRIPSITGNEEPAVKMIADWLQDAGADTDYWNEGIAALQRDARYPGHEVERAWVPMAVGVLRGARPGPSVLLTGHVDVVPPANYEDWRHEPFSGLVLTLYDAMRRDEEAHNSAETHPLMAPLGLPYATCVGKVRGGQWSSTVMDSLEVTSQ